MNENLTKRQTVTFIYLLIVILLSFAKIFTRNCQVCGIRLSNSDEASRNNQAYTEWIAFNNLVINF